MYSYRNYKLVVTALLSAFCLNNSDAEIGSEAWSFQTGDAVVSSPTLDSAGNIYFGSVDGKRIRSAKMDRNAGQSKPAIGLNRRQH